MKSLSISLFLVLALSSLAFAQDDTMSATDDSTSESAEFSANEQSCIASAQENGIAPEDMDDYMATCMGSDSDKSGDTTSAQ